MKKNNLTHRITKNLLGIGTGVAFMATTSFPALAQDVGAYLKFSFGSGGKSKSVVSLNMFSGDNSASADSLYTNDFQNPRYNEVAVLSSDGKDLINNIYNTINGCNPANLTEGQKTLLYVAGGAVVVATIAGLALSGGSDGGSDGKTSPTPSEDPGPGPGPGL